MTTDDRRGFDPATMHDIRALQADLAHVMESIKEFASTTSYGLAELAERLKLEIDDRRNQCKRLADQIGNVAGQMSDMRGE